MPNIGAVLREEIARLSRRENRSEIDKTRKATTQHRREIAQLKRQVIALERQLKLLVRRGINAAPTASQATANSKSRFVAKGLRSQRTRLGLSAAEFGKLVGVSAQSVYNWEGEKARPRGDQLARLASLRGVGKREAAARLAQAAGASPRAAKAADSSASKGKGKRRARTPLSRKPRRKAAKAAKTAAKAAKTAKAARAAAKS